jgi:hypothetical protein
MQRQLESFRQYGTQHQSKLLDRHGMIGFADYVEPNASETRLKPIRASGFKRLIWVQPVRPSDHKA